MEISEIPKSIRDSLGDEVAKALVDFSLTFINQKTKNKNSQIDVPPILWEKLGDDAIGGLIKLLDAVVADKTR